MTDHLYDLLPAIHRIRDDEQGLPLRDLLRVIAEQVQVIEDDIEQLYENWFIETAQDWVVPYLGELVGYRPVSEAGDPATAGPGLVRALVPRREVASTIRAHRRKGTLALLEELARDVAGWPARAVEFFRLLDVFQNVNHVHTERGLTVDLHRMDALDRLDGPFDELAHTVDVRRIQSAHQPGRFDIPSVGVFVWRLNAYSITDAPAACIEEVSPASFTFSVLGNDAPLFTAPVPEPDEFHVSGEVNLPVPMRRLSLASDLAAYYGRRRSFEVLVGAGRGAAVTRSSVPIDQLVVADLTDWTYRPRRDTVAIDPVLGRIAFPPGQAPTGVWVSYHCGFSADMGGGEYGRALADAGPATFRQVVAKTGQEVDTIEEALRRWELVRRDQPTAVIELADSEVYTEQLTITLFRGESLEIRAADRTRPVIHLLDRQRNQPDAMRITSGVDDDGAGEERQPGGCFRLDGILVTGRAVHVEGPLQRVELRHCTLVPGWGIDGDCEPRRPSEPSLELYRTAAKVHIERCIVGSIQVYEDEVTADPVEVCILDSIVDATRNDREAVGAPNWPLAHAALTLQNCTVFGQVQTHAILLGENTIFTGIVRVARRQLGCLRYCYVPPGSRTPRRHRCQPDLVDAVDDVRVIPRFTSVRYGTPAYAQLADTCAVEIVRGADDESEMGAFHDLYQPQRLANLRARLEQFSPARTDIAVITAS